MNVYSCTNFTGVWPTQTAAVVVASNQAEAIALLLDAILRHPGIDYEKQKIEDWQLEWIDPSKKAAFILSDGDY